MSKFLLTVCAALTATLAMCLPASANSTGFFGHLAFLDNQRSVK
jgi:hypothetical protein